jgi:uncharacterized membrane-anchored protein YitT (DUF2179 family)
LRGFLLPNNFIDGGAVGISLLITEIAGLYLPLVLVLVNAPFILLGIRIIGTWFAIKTAVAIGLLALAVAFIPYPEMTQDKLLVAGFGGFFLGAGIGLAVRGGCVIDGTEVMAIFMSRKTGLTIGDVILIINIIIFSFAAYLLSVETAMYAVLTYLAASKTVDFIIEGIEEYTGVTIISHKQEAIKDVITNELGRGFTIYKGERGFGKKGKSKEQVDIVYTVVTRLEVSKLKGEVEKIDPEAFIIMHSIIDTKGGMIKKRSLKH